MLVHLQYISGLYSDKLLVDIKTLNRNCLYFVLVNGSFLEFLKPFQKYKNVLLVTFTSILFFYDY